MLTFEGDTKHIKGKRREIKAVLKKMMDDHHSVIGNLQYVFVDDNYLLELNRKVLKHDYYTDIITFDYSNKPLINGEIYISLDRIIENASKFEVPFHVELRRVMFHGVLHLLGYKDKSKEQKIEMRKQEDKYIKYNQSIVPHGTL